MYFTSWPREGCCSLPYFFFTTHSLSLLFFSLWQVRRRRASQYSTVFNDVAGIIRDTGPNGAAAASAVAKSGASQRRTKRSVRRR